MMLKIKLFVIIGNVFIILANKYCEICPNHTLCKYPVPGAADNCIGYKDTLTQDDVKEILDRINERRNFVAMGHSRYLPQAANMRKITWSNELADSAQRWADQCDPSIRPDKEDDCRDLETGSVGQNIATITGVSSRVKVRNFIDIWFMESLAYTGSVAYYNMSQDSECNYFTQLIWARTDNVGCGRARFYIRLNGLPKLVDRLVCNFSPKGNIHGRPIYAIGFPATQCDHRMVQDSVYSGLCTSIAVSAPSTSFLRIRSSITNDIEPIESHYKLIKDVTDSNGVQSSQIRHVYNNSFVLKRDSHNNHKNIQRSSSNDFIKNDGSIREREKGHSRLTHGHDHTDEFDYLHPGHTSKIQTYETTTPMNRQNGNQECTRKSELSSSDNWIKLSHSPIFIPLKKCTRETIVNIENESGYETTTRYIRRSTQKPCRFSIFRVTAPTNPSPCFQCNNCECVKTDPLMNVCAMKLYLDKSKQRDSLIEKSEDKPDVLRTRNNYNVFVKNEKASLTEDFWNFNIDESRHIPVHKNISRHNLSNRNRKRRDSDDTVTFRPFWQEDELNNGQYQLKSIRYTTIGNKKSRKRKPLNSAKTQKAIKVTEPITISANVSNQKRPTEKYLSFDELLRLRKINDEISARRADSPISSDEPTVTAVESSTSEYTANTPFIRLKHCTRKLTCTWTAASLGNEGNADIGNRGSRTPPGYVEGCTRTSTCTRDYMNRNKMDTLPTSTTEINESDDEDYCEKRSLNVRRRNLPVIEDSIAKVTSSLPIEVDNGDVMQPDHQTCECDNVRKKRKTNHNKKVKRDVDVYSTLSYGDLFYLVLRKIIKKWKDNMSEKCLCNFATTNRCEVLVMFILQMFNLFSN